MTLVKRIVVIVCHCGKRIGVLDVKRHADIKFICADVNDPLSVLPQSVFNAKPDPSEETEEEKEQKHKTFVEKYEKDIKHFGKPFLFS